MRKTLRRRLSPSTLIATIALIVASSGTAIAAGEIITSSDQIKDGVVTQADERNPSLRARIAKNGTLIRGDVIGTQHVKGSNRYDLEFRAADLGSLGLDNCAITVSPAFQGFGPVDHQMLRAYVNHAPNSASIQVFTYGQTTLFSTKQTVEVPVEAQFDVVLGC